jgi:NADPH2 dehydrogenase
MSERSYRRIASLKGTEQLLSYLTEWGIPLGFDETVESGPGSVLGTPYPYGKGSIGNRFCILPMEGWDGTPDGQPTELTKRRWRHFGESGAKLIWGGEAVAVRPDGRANPNQLLINPQTVGSLATLRHSLVEAHEARYGAGASNDLLVGLQLTHSGRFARPSSKARLEPKILYHHPILDQKFGITPSEPCLTDLEIGDLIGDFVRAARLAQEAGFAFVDLKHCHGYLGHEFLSATTRPGRYGGSFENRTRFLRELVAGIRQEAPGLELGVRVSAFDQLPFRKGPDRRGEPEPFAGPYWHAFGAAPAAPSETDLEEPFRFFGLLEELEIALVCVTAGSPYYNPHIQRPALFPPSDGYQPPEDPLVGVARQLAVTGEIKERFPSLCVVGSGYSYLQEWLPHVAQHQIRTGRVDFVGLGRMVLSYPHLPEDVLAGRPLQAKKICRTFSDCTTAPRNGLVSGCFPLDPFYRDHPDASALRTAKEALRPS